MRQIACSVLVIMAGAAPAFGETVWGIEAYNDVCRVILDEDSDRIGEGNVRHLDQGCRFGPLARYEAVGDGNVRLIDTNGQAVALLERTTWGYEGMIGDGDTATLRVMETGVQPQTNRQPPVRPLASPRGADIAQCVRYIDSNQCAFDTDLGHPGDRFDPLPVETRARMNVRFMGTLNASKVGDVAPGTCMDVRRCSENLIDDQIWCEVNYSGNKWGWILKQDENYVYAGTSCG